MKIVLDDKEFQINLAKEYQKVVHSTYQKHMAFFQYHLPKTSKLGIISLLGLIALNPHTTHVPFGPIVDEQTTCLYVLLSTYGTEENLEKSLPGILDKLLNIEHQHRQLYAKQKDVTRFFKYVHPCFFDAPEQPQEI
jgi:hypothetical protein